ncbi:MAG: energy transducer TonB [Deltaproteobacteria bacterium]|nr:energy transducer TonB [Deltaproteobacteria bacterium]
MNTVAVTSESVGLAGNNTLCEWNEGEAVGKEAAEVAVAWNGIIQDVVQCPTDVENPWTFSIGEDPRCNFLIPAEVLQGVAKTPLVEVRDGVVNVIVFPGAEGEVVYADGTRIPLESVLNSEDVMRGYAMPGACAFPLRPQGQVEMNFGAWSFRVRSSQRVEKFSAPIKLDWSSSTFLSVSFAMHAIFFLLAYLVPPDANGLSLDPNSSGNRFTKYMLTPPEVHTIPVPEMLKKPEKAMGGEMGQRHKDIEGQAGDRRVKDTGKRLGVKGPRNNPDPHMAKLPTKEMARSAGILQYLSSAAAPTSPFGRETALGVDPENALGALTQGEYGASSGYGGLGLKGTGRGGGGNGEGTLGVGSLGTIGTGTGRGPGMRYGKFTGDLKSRRSRGPRLIPGKSTVTGSLSKEVIRRVVRRHINEVKFCYEQGLRKRPDISGRVAVKFLISRSGAVQGAAVTSSTLDDPGVESCIARTVRRMAFPQPKDGGIVVVTYPFSLHSPDN